MGKAIFTENKSNYYFNAVQLAIFYTIKLKKTAIFFVTTK